MMIVPLPESNPRSATDFHLRSFSTTLNSIWNSTETKPTLQSTTRMSNSFNLHSHMGPQSSISSEIIRLLDRTRGDKWNVAFRSALCFLRLRKVLLKRYKARFDICLFFCEVLPPKRSRIRETSFSPWFIYQFQFRTWFVFYLKNFFPPHDFFCPTLAEAKFWVLGKKEYLIFNKTHASHQFQPSLF